MLILLAPAEVPSCGGSPVSDTCPLGRGPKLSCCFTHSERLSGGNSIRAAVQGAVPHQYHRGTGTIWSFSWPALTSAEQHQLEGRLLEETTLSSAFPNRV